MIDRDLVPRHVEEHVDLNVGGARFTVALEVLKVILPTLC
jgi:hypothetical protein